MRWLVAGLAALPWTWFAVRDTAALLEWGAVLLPALVAGAVGLVLAVALVRRSAAGVAVAAAWAVFGAVATVVPWSPQDSGTPGLPLRLVSANVRGDNPSPERVAEDLLLGDGDVLVVSELTPLQQPVVERMDRRYPYSVLARPDAGVGVWSRYPLSGRDLPADGLLAASRGLRVVVQAPAGPVVLYALHLFRPSRDAFRFEVTVQDQRRLVDAVDALADGEQLPALIAGDLNATDRGSAYRRLAAGRVDAMRSSWTGRTSLRRRNLPLLLRIDHLLVPRGWCSSSARRLPLTGSDHRAVLASVGPCS